jgi:UDP-N-acetyl-D-glucosamine dehydrogenase
MNHPPAYTLAIPADAALKARIQAAEARVLVVGLGYVGLSLAVSLGRSGFRVVGVDIDLQRVTMVNGGRSHVSDIDDAELQDLLTCGRLSASTDFRLGASADVIVICVPTPLRKSKEPDMSFILAAADQLLPFVHAGQLIVLESTTYPGTTEEVLQPRLESRGFTIGRDIFVAFSPERVDPGNRTFTTTNIPKVVGGITAACTDVAAALYAKVTSRVHRVSSPRVAETAKLLENTFRSVNIALANELALACRTLNVDPWEVIEAAATKPFGFMPFYPGPGTGGHCIPLDPLYLSWKVRMNGFETRFIALADEVNHAMPRHIVSLVIDSLNERGRCLRGANVLVLGVTYKADVNDVRESPALDIIRLLRHRGARVDYADPYVPELLVEDVKLVAVPLTPASLGAADCAVIVTDHRVFDYRAIARDAALIVDVRNALREVRDDRDNIVTL